jgi:hypothetical protein
MFGRSESEGSSLPPLGIFTPEADDRALSYLPPEVIASALDDFQRKQSERFAETVQLELPFAEVSTATVV